MPHPVRPKIIMTPRYSDPGSVQRSRQTRLSKSDVVGRSFHLYAELWKFEAVKVKTGSLKPFQKTGLAGIGEVLPKKIGELWLDFLLVLSNESPDLASSEWKKCSQYITLSPILQRYALPGLLSLPTQNFDWLQDVAVLGNILLSRDWQDTPKYQNHSTV